MKRFIAVGRSRRSLRLPLAAALLTVPAAACDNILEVEDPDVVRPPQLEGAAGIPSRVNGAILDLQIAFNGNFNNSLVVAQGLFTDEYYFSDTFTDRGEVDRRNINRDDNQIILNVFSGLILTRTSAAAAIDAINEFEPDNENLSLMHSIHGFTDVFLGESFCAGVPISTLVGNTIEFGTPRTMAETFEDAIDAFDAAIAADPAADAARIGKGRALVDLGRYDEAAAVVAGVATGFAEFVRHSSTAASQNNGLWSLSTNGRLTVWDHDGGNGLAFRSANDPRVPWLDTGGLGWDEETPLYLQLVQPDIDSDVPLATGIEARLIEAEAALDAGDRAGFFSAHNAARATENLAPLTDNGELLDELVDLHFSERGFWFYSTAHRLGDLRRLVRQYGRDAESVFPTGAYQKGGTFGSDVNFPIPVEEDNNPNTRPLEQGCLDRSA
ncbi:MAG: tetratricopeptide repeat protein [Longimicrobiales bacterium]